MEHKHANPACLGLLGFGMTTVLLNIHNIGVTELSIVIVAMGICLGGLAQFVAGLMEFKNGNTFGATAFTAYGLFWWSLVLIWILHPEQTGLEVVSHPSLGWYMVLWCIFTFFMWIGTLKGGKALMLVFLTLWILFLFLALENFTGMELMGRIAGVVGIICGALAIYTSVAEVINEQYGCKKMPV